MKRRKMAALLMAAVMTMGLVTGCGTGSTEPGTASNGNSSSANTSSESKETGSSTTAKESKNDNSSSKKTTGGSGKVLVVYYSATGNTKAVAESIADATGGDTFEIEPKEPYTDDDLDWTNDNSRVSKEHDDESLRDVELKTTTVKNWELYDTVFIGYPIWWYVAAWPVNTFVKNNDFSGKTVIPFCTSASSGVADSGQLLADMAGTGDWQDGERFSSGASDSEVADWVKELGYAK
ncbi:MAG: flavodoxin [Clostridium sp. CAG:12237_41]|nr:MAG: flavodoxin [Clostridium sp. CAG:12237_41]